MKIYTKTGDQGTTSLVGGERVAKDDPRVEAYGNVDELSAQLALLMDNMDEQEPDLAEYREDIMRIQATLMSVEAILAMAGTDSAKMRKISPIDISYLEARIDYIQEQLQPITHFILPGGHPLVSLCHICRTVCRRAERRAAAVAREYDVPDAVTAYLNRLSDYLYQLGRKMGEYFNIKETYWMPDK